MSYYNQANMERQANLVIAFNELSIKSSNPLEAYTVITGNFDGAGLSYGWYQWNFITENLQPMFQEMLTNHDTDVREAFDYSTDPTDYNTFKTVIETYSTVNQIAWGDSISNPSNKHEVIEPWNTYFYNLGTYTSMQTIQDTAMASYITLAHTFFNTYTALTPATYGSQRFFTLCLDQAVNSGGIPAEDVAQITADYLTINTQNRTQEEIEIEKMKIFAKWAVRQKSQPFYAILRPRRDTIARGEGYVNGEYINLEKDFNITMEEAFPSTAPSTLPRQANRLQETTVDENWDFIASPKVRGEMVQTNRLTKLSSTVEEKWKFKKGITQDSTYIVKSGNSDATTKYYRLARLRCEGSSGRISLRGELLHTSSSVKMGTLEIFLKDSPNGTVHSDSRFTVINEGNVTASKFGTGDVFYQKWVGSTDNLYIDIWVRMLQYSQLSFNVTSLVCENGTSFEIDPIEEYNLLDAIPSASSTLYWCYNKVGEDFGSRENCTAQTAVEFTYRNNTMAGRDETITGNWNFTGTLQQGGNTVLTPASSPTVTGNWNHTGTLQQGGNNVLTTASIISDIGSSAGATYETLLTNSIDGVLDVQTMNGMSAFNQISDATFNDVPNWYSSVTNVTAISDPIYSNSMQITATASTGEHYVARTQNAKDSMALINGREYFILTKFNIRSFARLQMQLYVKNTGGTYDIYYSNIPAVSTNDWLYIKTPALSVNATPDISLRYYLLSGSNEQNWTTTGSELVSVTEPKIIDLTANRLTALSSTYLLEAFKLAPQFRYRKSVENLTITSLNNGKTSSDSVTFDALGISSLKSLSTSVYDTYNEDTRTLSKKIATVTGVSTTATINTTTCPSMKTSGGLFFAYTTDGYYQYGVYGDTLALTASSGIVSVDYERTTASTSTLQYGINLQSWANSYFRMEGGILPYTTVRFPRNMAGAVNTNSLGILVNDNNIQTLSNRVSTYQVVSKTNTGDEYVRLGRITMSGTSTYGRAYLKINLGHTGTYSKAGELQVFIYKVSGNSSLHAQSYSWIINNSGMPTAFASGDVVYQNWIPSVGTIGYTDIYIKVQDYAKVHYMLSFSYYENNAVYEFLPSDNTLLSAVPSTGATQVIGGVVCTAEASVNATVKTVTMT